MRVDHPKAVIYVPVACSRLDCELIPGSGVVGVERDDHLVICYEGNLYGAHNLNQISERIVCAYGRLATRYPTIAMKRVLADERGDLIAVGEIAWPNYISLTPDGRKLLEAYAARHKSAVAPAC